MTPATRYRSYRGLLTRRFSALWAAGLLVISLALHFAVRTILLRHLDRSLTLVASLQASAVAQSPPGRMQLREWQLTEDEARRLQDVIWQIQVWDEHDCVVVQSENVEDLLPPPPNGLESVREGRVVFVTGEHGGRSLRQVFYPLQRLDPEHLGHVIQVAASLEPFERTLLRIDIVLIAVGILGLLITTWLSWSTSTRAIQPVSAILEEVRRIQSPGEGRRITAFARTREFNELVVVLNEMLDRLEGAYDAERRFTADASHELRSPLTAIRGTLEVALRRDRDAEFFERSIRSVLEEVHHMQDLVNDLLVLARQDAGVLKLRQQAVDCREMIESVKNTLSGSADEKGVTIDTSGILPQKMFVDPQMIRRVFVNLLDNAIRYSPEGGSVRISLERFDEVVRFAVQDDGPGIPEEARDQVFDRFYRSEAARTAGEGAGLGLSIARAIVVAHGGRIWVEARDKGTSIRMELPAA